MRYEDSWLRLKSLMILKGRTIENLVESLFRQCQYLRLDDVDVITQRSQCRLLRNHLVIMTFASQAFENLYTDICEGKYKHKSLKLPINTSLSDDGENMKKSSSDSDNEYDYEFGMRHDDDDDDNRRIYRMHRLLLYGAR